MEELIFVQCQRDHAVFRIGDWGTCDLGRLRLLGRRRNRSGIPSAARPCGVDIESEVRDIR